jgi:hypothetical protein
MYVSYTQHAAEKRQFEVSQHATDTLEHATDISEHATGYRRPDMTFQRPASSHALPATPTRNLSIHPPNVTNSEINITIVS